MKKYIFPFLFTFLLYNTVFAQWVQTNGPEGGNIYALAHDSSTIYAGTNSGIYKSFNNGNSWMNITNGITFSYTNKAITTIATSKNFVFVGTLYNGIYFTSDQGQTWNTPSVLNSSTINAIAASGDTLVAGTTTGIFLSTDLGITWIDISTGLTNTNVISVSINGSTIIAGTFGSGIFITTNNGSTWSQNNLGLIDLTINTIKINGTTLYTCTDDGVYSSINNGASWISLNNGLTGYFNEIDFIGTKIFVGGGGGIFLSSDSGTSWTNIDPNLLVVFPQSLHSWAGNLFLGLNGNGIYVTSDDGTTWFEKNSNLFSAEVVSIASDSTSLYACVPSGGVYKSTTNGISWAQVNNGLINLLVNEVAINDSIIYACTSNGLYTSNDSGSNWNPNNLIGQSNITTIAFNGANIYCGSGSGSGIYYSNNNGLSWVTLNNGLGGSDILSLAVSGNTLYAGSIGNGFYVSTNNGANWTAANSGLSGTTIYSIQLTGSGILVGTDDGIFLSSNNGSSWVSLYNPGFSVEAIAVKGGSIFLSAGERVYLSQNNGSTWTPVDSGLADNSFIRTIGIIGNFIYAGTEEGLWYRPLYQMLGTTLIPQVDSIQAVSCFGGQDGSVSVSVSGGTAPYTFTWMPSGGTGSSANGLSAGNYIVFIEDSLQAQTSVTISIPQPPILSGALTLATSSCIVNDGSASIIPSGGTSPYSYLWSTNDTLAAISGLAPGAYSLVIEDANACSTTIPFSIATTNYPSNAPAICLTTVDSLSQHNVILWQKDSLVTYIDSFRIYRLDASTYEYVASIGYNQLSEYTDVDPIADPQVNIRRYKLATVDVCGNVSSLSDFHTTILLTDFQNGIFQYTPYDIQNQTSTLVQQYLLQRLDSATGSWNTINTNPGSVTGTIIAPNYASYSYASYRILADLGTYTCTPTARVQQGISVTRSNIKNRLSTGVQTTLNSSDQVKFHPNPAKDAVQITTTIELEIIYVYDNLGRLVITHKLENPKSSSSTLNTSGLAAGVYTMQCEGKDFELRKKLVVE